MNPRVLPFKVNQGHWNRHGSIGSMTYSNYGPIRTVSDVGDFGRILYKKK